jgi:4-amino-4-deoxy-L-arabinose transferase-like glycosyltransferase
MAASAAVTEQARRPSMARSLGSAASGRTLYPPILLLALLARAGMLAHEPFWRDETDSLLFARAPLADLLQSFGRGQHNGPAYHVVLRGWTELVGTSDVAVRALSTLADVVGLCLVAAAARRLGGARVGLVAGAIWAVLPAALWYAREAKMYSLLSAIAAACLYLTAMGLASRPPARARGRDGCGRRRLRPLFRGAARPAGVGRRRDAGRARP